MIFEAILFGLAFVVALGCALAMLFARNPVHVALFLVGVQVALALTFLLQGAFFIAAVQIIVYAGAIMVLFLFVIMLLGVDRQELLSEPLPGQRPLSIGFGSMLCGLVIFAVLRVADALPGGGEEALTAVNRDPGNVIAIARATFGRFMFPFEATSILLVVAIVGVMTLARRMGMAETSVPAPAASDEEAAA